MDGRERTRQRIEAGVRAKREARASGVEGADGGDGAQGKRGKREIRATEIEVRGSVTPSVRESPTIVSGASDRTQTGDFYGTQQTLDGQDESSFDGYEGNDGGDWAESDRPNSAQQPKGRRRKAKRSLNGKLADNADRKTQEEKRGLVSDDDCEDVKLMIQGVASGIASATQYDDFNYTDEQAYAVAKPLARIMARHGFDEKVRKLSDPLLLLLATATTAGPKIAGYKLWVKERTEIEKAMKLRVAQEAYQRASAGTAAPSGYVGEPQNQPSPEQVQYPGTVSGETVQGPSSTVFDLRKRINEG